MTGGWNRITHPLLATILGLLVLFSAPFHASALPEDHDPGDGDLWSPYEIETPYCVDEESWSPPWQLPEGGACAEEEDGWVVGADDDDGTSEEPYGPYLDDDVSLDEEEDTTTHGLKAAFELVRGLPPVRLALGAREVVEERVESAATSIRRAAGRGRMDNEQAEATLKARQKAEALKAARIAAKRAQAARETADGGRLADNHAGGGPTSGHTDSDS